VIFFKNDKTFPTRGVFHLDFYICCRVLGRTFLPPLQYGKKLDQNKYFIFLIFICFVNFPNSLKVEFRVFFEDIDKMQTKKIIEFST